MINYKNSSRVFVTQVGIHSCLGRHFNETVSNLKNGVSGLVYEEIQGYPTAIGRIPFNIKHKNNEFKDKGLQLALNVVSQTDAASNIDSDRVGVFWGVGLASAHCLENTFTQYIHSKGSAFLSPWTVADIMPNSVASQIAKTYGIRGGCWTLSNACASSAMAIGQGFQAIRQGHLDAAVVGGSDAMLIPPILYAWSRMRVLTRTTAELAHESCRPFDCHRKGLAISEGAACLILQSERVISNIQTTAMAEITGFGHSCDAADITKPLTEGQLAAMYQALCDSGLPVDEIDYVCAHATGTLVGDPVEMHALKSLWRGHIPHCPISSLKSALGHSMAACGAMQAVLCVSMLRDKWIAPTLYLDRPDDLWRDWWLPSSNVLNDYSLNHILSNSFGFGGINASLILSAIHQKPKLI